MKERWRRRRRTIIYKAKQVQTMGACCDGRVREFVRMRGKRSIIEMSARKEVGKVSE